MTSMFDSEHLSLQEYLPLDEEIPLFDLNIEEDDMKVKKRSKIKLRIYVPAGANRGPTRPPPVYFVMQALKVALRDVIVQTLMLASFEKTTDHLLLPAGQVKEMASIPCP